MDANLFSQSKPIGHDVLSAQTDKTLTYFAVDAYYRLNDLPIDPEPAIAVNQGSWPNANGLYKPGATPLAAGVPYPAFGTNNTAAEFAGTAGSATALGSCIEIPAQIGTVNEMGADFPQYTCWNVINSIVGMT